MKNLTLKKSNNWLLIGALLAAIFVAWAAPHVWSCIAHDFVTGK